MNRYAAIEKKTFDLSNGHLVDAELLEREILKICHYVQRVTLAVKDRKHIVAIIYPNKELFSAPDFEKSPEQGCFCPRNLGELGKCLSGCIQAINNRLMPGYAPIHSAVLVSAESSLSAKIMATDEGLSPQDTMQRYSDQLHDLFGGKDFNQYEVFNMKLN